MKNLHKYSKNILALLLSATKKRSELSPHIELYNLELANNLDIISIEFISKTFTLN